MTAIKTPVGLAFMALATALLIASWAWPIPMMLWDHLDLPPMIEAAQRGALNDSAFWAVHGGHLHSAAYAVLLLTTALSGGQPWLDSLVSWLLLLTTAAVLVALALRTVPAGRYRQRWLLAIVLLALYPGHLANLQWGWQVAVFLCLLCSVLAVVLLAGSRLTWRSNLLALACAVIALLSFATALALVATALVLIAWHQERPWHQRTGLAMPWLMLGALAATPHLASNTGGGASALTLLLYALNYLGGGIARYATDPAPWLAAAALLVAAVVLRRHPRPMAARPWLGLLLFAAIGAIAVALGRASAYGSDHAFATRYVSFSVLFWLGWLGLLATATQSERWRRGLGVLAAGMLVLATINAAQLTRKAARLSAQSQTTAHTIRATWPQVDDSVLRAIYFDQPEQARTRLALLHRFGYPPFDVPAIGAAIAPR